MLTVQGNESEPLSAVAYYNYIVDAAQSLLLKKQPKEVADPQSAVRGAAMNWILRLGMSHENKENNCQGVVGAAEMRPTGQRSRVQAIV